MPDRQIAAAYIRVSTDDQVEFSPDSQAKKIKEYAKSHNLILPDKYIYVDEGISGRDATHRPAFNEMIGTAKTKPRPFDVILVWKFSRFARNREDSIVYKSMLRKQCGISVISISESLGDDKTSILIEALIEAMDEYYSINLAEEVKRGMSEKAARGGVVSVPAFGYSVKEGKYVPNENAPLVVGMFEDYANGMGFRAIATKYSELGVKTRAGNALDNRFVEYLLRNPVYIGKIRWSPDGNGASKRNFDNPNIILSNGNHEPIIGTELWDKVQQRVAEQKRKYGKFQRREQPIQYMLKGLVRCSNCGATLIMAQNKNSQSLQCHNYGRGSCNVSHSISINKINNAVINDLKEAVESMNFNIAPETIVHNEKNIDINRLIEKEQQKLERARIAYTEGIDTIDEYRATKSQIQSNIKKLQSQAPKVEKVDVGNLIAKATNALDIIQNPKSTEEQKNNALRGIIKGIVYDKSNSTIEVEYYA